MHHRSLLIALFMICMPIVASADESKELPKTSVSDFVTPDGHFDLDGARRSGFEGALDLDGFDLRLDPVSGEPLIRHTSINTTESDPDDVFWNNFISPSIRGIVGTVYALTVYDGRLVVGGAFQAAGNAVANNIASWDGSSWSSMGSGMNYTVVALTVYNGQLVAGGSFTTAGGVSANYIASWDGSSWSSMGSGMNNRVLALTVYDGQLVAGGDFTTAGGLPANRIASWDGSSWSSVGSGMNNFVIALTVYDGQLVAGGLFTAAGGVSANYIASWNGSSWSPLGSGLNSTVLALTVYDGQLVAGGGFQNAGGVPAIHIASWDGSSWSPLGLGLNSGVNALTVYDGQLIAGGDFKTAFGVSANFIASWNGSSWSPMGLGMSAWVNALTVYDGQLVAGGIFRVAGGVLANSIASWDGSDWSSMGSGMDSSVYALTVFDGKLIAAGSFTTAGGLPASRIASWDGSRWSSMGSGMNYPVRALTVYNGQLVAGGEFTTAGGVSANYIASWDGSSWSSMGSGMNYDVRALTVYDGQLVAGGEFDIAGDKVSAYLAVWNRSMSSYSIGIDSIVIDHGGGMVNKVDPDAIKVIEPGDTPTVYGTVRDNYNMPAPNFPVEVYDGVSYAYDLAIDGLYNITTDANGVFAYEAKQPLQSLAISQVYPFWFSAGSAAIPLILPYVGDCNSVDCLSDFFGVLESDLTNLPDSTIISLSAPESPLTLTFASYPPVPDDLDNPLNDDFFEGFVHLYGGTVDREFLGTGTNSWLERGLLLSGQRFDQAASGLHSQLQSNMFNSWFSPKIKINGKWEDLSNHLTAAEINGIFENQSTWDMISLGIGGAACLGGILAGGVLGVVTCYSFGLSLANVWADEIAVPLLCANSEDQESCKQTGKLITDGATIVAQLVVTKGAPSANYNVDQFQNYFSMSKSAINQLHWAAEILNAAKAPVGYINYAYDLTDYAVIYWPDAGTGYQEAIGVTGISLQSSLYDGLSSFPMQVAASTNHFAAAPVRIEFDDPANPTKLIVQTTPVRNLMDNTGQQVEPQCSIESNLSSIPVTWVVIDNENLTYSTEILMSELPNYSSSQPYSAEVNVDGYDIFGNYSSSSNSFAVGFCTVDGFDFRTPDGMGVSFPPASVSSPLYIQQSTDFNMVAPWYRQPNELVDSAVILSSAVLVVAPDTASLAQPVLVQMKIDSTVAKPIINAGIPIWIGRNHTAGQAPVQLETELDTLNWIVTADTDSLGRFAVMATVQVEAGCCQNIRGNVNDDLSDAVNISDVTYLVSYLFGQPTGPEPPCVAEGNVNGDPSESINISDVTYLVAYLFGQPNGPAPPACP